MIAGIPAKILICGIALVRAPETVPAKAAPIDI